MFSSMLEELTVCDVSPRLGKVSGLHLYLLLRNNFVSFKVNLAAMDSSFGRPGHSSYLYS